MEAVLDTAERMKAEPAGGAVVIARPDAGSAKPGPASDYSVSRLPPPGEAPVKAAPRPAMPRGTPKRTPVDPFEFLA